jgi:hypothetical protein
MKHVRVISQGPKQATTTLQVLASFFVLFVDLFTNILFQKNGGAL